MEALLTAGHEVRAFGVPPGSTLFDGLDVATFPGTLAVGGSIEPALSECQALVHAATLDEPGKDAQAHAFHVERGTLYARYGAERELVQQAVYLFPESPARKWASVLAQAEAHAKATRTIVPHTILRVSDPSNAAKHVVAALANVVVEA